MNDPYKTPEEARETDVRMPTAGKGRLPRLFLIGTWFLVISIIWVLSGTIASSMDLHRFFYGWSTDGTIAGFPIIIAQYTGFMYGLPLGLIGILLQMISFSSLLRK